MKNWKSLKILQNLKNFKFLNFYFLLFTFYFFETYKIQIKNNLHK